MPFKSVPLNYSLTVSAPGTVIGSVVVGGIQQGLEDFSVWLKTIRISQNSGGVLDVYLQTQDSGLYGTPWVDIAHLTQVPAGSGTLTYRISFNRDVGVPAAPVVVNNADSTPSLAAGQILQWANGSNVRLVVVAGAGVSGPSLVQVTGLATMG